MSEVSVHQVRTLLCRLLGRGGHHLCLNMDGPLGERTRIALSRDRSDLQGRGAFLESSQVFTLGGARTTCSHPEAGARMPRSSGRLRAEGLHTNIQPLSADSRCHDTTLARSGLLAPTVPEFLSPAGPLILAGWTPSLLPAGGFPPGRHTTQSASLCFGQLQWTNSSTKVPQHSHVCVYACPAPGMLCEWRTRMPHAARRMLQALHPPLAYAGSILIKIDFSLLCWVGRRGGGTPRWQRDIFGPQSLLYESMADDNRRCQMPSGKWKASVL